MLECGFLTSFNVTCGATEGRLNNELSLKTALVFKIMAINARVFTVYRR
jgi:hypothetical protein